MKEDVLGLAKQINRADCVVRALAVVCHGKHSYDEINQWLIDNGMRKNSSTRTNRGAALAFLKAHNIPFKHYYRDARYKFRGVRSVKDDRFDGLTVKSFEAENYPGKYLLAVSGHQLAVVDGVAVDWASGRSHRVLAITQILE